MLFINDHHHKANITDLLNKLGWLILERKQLQHQLAYYLLTGTQSSSCGSAHKADTRACHCSLSLDVFSSFPQIRLCSFISRSTVLLQVSFCLPLTRFPSGVHLRAVWTIAVCGILKTWPIHCHLHRFISNVMS